MSSKVDLQQELNQIGYQLAPFASKETFLNIRRLHSLVLTDQNLNVAELSDVELRKNLTKHGLIVGPVTNHTRPIYQRKLLEVLTNEPTEAVESDTDEYTPPPPAISNENRLYPNLSERKTFSYGLPRTYDEPSTIRNDYRATTSTRNTYRDRNVDDDSNEIRPRIPTKSNEQQTIRVNKDSTPIDKPQLGKKTGGTMLYSGITITVALIVFVLYFLMQK